uniref:Strombine dehydrogenase n=1 Tax=Sipunculus nudus TaxID=6446 RepID=B5D5P1_SIPNU|nr:strombine dehydrogenase [Sipunculus nudus]
MVVALICGGGNGAHVMAGTAASYPGQEVRVMTLFADEAERWSNALKDHDYNITFYSGGKESHRCTNKPKMVTKNPAEAVPGCDIIAFVVPAFAHRQYFEAIEPYIKPGVVIVGLPGQPGFEFAVRGILGEKAKQCTILSYESLPWACRIIEFGRTAEVLGVKKHMIGAMQLGHPQPPTDANVMAQNLLGEFPKLETRGHLVAMTLMATNAIIHPSILWAKWHENDEPVASQPLFYQGADDLAAATLSGLSDDVIAIAKGIKAKRPDADMSTVVHICDWYKRVYKGDIGDETNLTTILQTNNGYKGLKHPMEPAGDGLFKVNYNYRYLTEDIPYGLAVIRGIGELVGVNTPTIDKVITWCQDKMGREFLKDGKFVGKDLEKARCPQHYGLHSLDEIIGD